MTFWGFVFRLAVGSVAAPIVFSFMVVPLFGLLALTVRRSDSKLTPLAYPVLALLFISQLYLWGMWASYCAGLAVVRASDPEVTHTWLYYLVAFMFVTAPLAYLASKEQAAATSVGEVQKIQRGSILYKGAAIAAFVMFSLWPALMTVPYGWFLEMTVPMQSRGVGAGGEATSSGVPYEVRCKEPLPAFTLGRNSHPTKEQEAALCTCIWESLGTWERGVSEKLAKGKESEISQLHISAFPSRFGTAVKKCGGMKL